VTPNTTTSYSVTGTSSAGCVSQNAAVSIVTVNTNPTITVNSGSICAGQTFTLTASGATSYSFSGGSNTVTPNTTTSYSVTGTSSAGCVSQNAAVGTVTVNANPTITIASSNTLLCSGESVTITASGANSYSWSTLSGNASIVVSPTSNATYSVLGIDASGCMAIAALTQSVDPCTAIKKEKTINVTQIIRIYPNPNNGEFMVELNATGKVTISNMLGEIIFEGYQENGVFPMSLLHHSNGLYFLHFKNNRTSETVKIIKN
jgi:formylmethanofuran dehydrogenase subunit A